MIYEFFHKRYPRYKPYTENNIAIAMQILLGIVLCSLNNGENTSRYAIPR